jgi:hypothetical protein
MRSQTSLQAVIAYVYLPHRALESLYDPIQHPRFPGGTTIAAVLGAELPTIGVCKRL